MSKSEDLNPGRAAQQRYGGVGSTPPVPYRSGEDLSSAMSAPDGPQKCIVFAHAKTVGFIVAPPAGVTAYTINVGRWVRSTNHDKVQAMQDASDPTAPGNNERGDSLDGWLPVATLAVTGSSPLPLESLEVDTHGDPVGCYITALTGTPTGDQVFRLFARPVG